MMLSVALITAAVSACSDGNSPLESFSAGIELNVRQATVADGESLELTVYSRARTGARRVALDPSKVVWSSSSPEVAAVARGIVSAHRPGEATVTATSPEGWSAAANLSIQAVPSALEFLFSDLPEGEVGIPLSGPVSVRVTDRHGTPMSGVDVQFSPVNGAGTVSPKVQKSGNDGTLQTFWTLGTRAGSQALRASLVHRPDRWSELPAVARPGPVASVEILPPVDTIAGSPAVVVRAKLDDFYGNSVPGVPLSWMVISGGGSVSSSSDATDESGGMDAEWILGNSDEEQVVGARPGGGNGGGLATLSVDLRGVFVSPTEASIEMREGVQLTAEVRDRNGRVASDANVTWRSSDQGVASVSSEGLVHGIAPGTATITASAKGQSGSAEITVNSAPEPEPKPEPEPGEDDSGTVQEDSTATTDDLTDDGGSTSDAADLYADGEPTESRTITVTPDSASIEVEGSVTLIAVERWASGEVNHSAVFAWSSSNSKVATVDSNGRVAGLTVGKVTIKATRSGTSGSAEVNVLSSGTTTERTTQSEGTISSVTLSPSDQSLQEDETIHVRAIVKDDQGNEVETTALAWSSSNTSIVQVEPNGTGAYVTAGSTGSATVQATIDGRTGSANFTVSRTTSIATGAVPAFPGAEGWGATALNECRDKPIQVLQVTNRNTSGTGSLDQAIKDIRSDRFTFILFRTGGRIVMPSGGTRLNGSCVYMAGQTAPGDGIVLEGDGTTLWIRGGGGNISDIVMRHMRFRGTAGRTRNNLIIAKGDRIVLDHMSFSWTDNYVLAMLRYGGSNTSAPISNVSVQNSIVAEAFGTHPTAIQLGSNSILKDEPTIGMTNVSLQRNLLAHNSHRNPQSGADNAVYVNNVLYNWNQGTMQMTMRGTTDYLNNFGKAGPMTSSRYMYMVNPRCESDSVIEDFSIYAAGNIGPMSQDPNGDNWSGPTRQVACYYKSGGTDGQEVPRNWRRGSTQNWGSAPFPIRVRSASAAFDAVLNDVGANAGLTCDGGWINRQDPVDARVIRETRNGNGPSSPPASEEAAGGYPSYSAGTPCPDTDGDGLPDAWEQRFFGSPTGASASAMGRNGYLILEHYLNGTTP